MRDTAKAAPAKSNPRKPSGHGAGMPSGHLYLAVLVATVAAFFVVPVAQAAASAEFKANITGNGGGKVSSAGGIGAFPGFEEFGSAWQGEPPIECSYASPGSATGVCKNEVPSEEGLSALALRAIPAPGSEFAGWTLKNVSNEPLPGVDCSSTPNCFGVVTPGPEREATAVFCTTGTAQGWGEACEVVPPHLTVYKTGEGTVVISPGGIECTPAKNPCLFEGIELNQSVTLTASPASGWAFSSWAGCTEHIGLTCKVKMEKARAVKVTFVATPSLTVEKAGFGYGYGKVAATGISCDENCSKASSAIKTGTSVTVKATPAKGSEAAVFEGGTGSASGCSGVTCTFTITANSSVKVKFDPKPTKTLIVNLTGPAANKGRVSGKGKGPYGPAISCGSGCTTQTESFFSTDEVALSASAPAGYTFSGWNVTGGEPGECTGTKSPCYLRTDADKTVSAEFK